MLWTFLSLILTTLSWAQFETPTNFPDVVSQTTNAVIATLIKKNHSKDTLSGICEFQGSSCNGAEISLYKKGEKVFTATLTANGEFDIPNLQKRGEYQFELSWPKHGLMEKRSITSGEFIKVNLSKP